MDKLTRLPCKVQMHITQDVFCSSVTPSSVRDLSKVSSTNGRKVRRVFQSIFAASSRAGNKFQGNLKKNILSCKYVCKSTDMSVCGVRETTVVLRKISLRRASIFFLPKQSLQPGLFSFIDSPCMWAQNVYPLKKLEV